MKFRYAIFDMDGLMYDTERLFISAYLEHISQVAKIPFKREELLDFLGITREAAEKLFKEYYDSYNSEYDFERCRELCGQWIADYLEQNGMPLKKGLVELLKWLKENGFKIALATSSYREVADNYFRYSKLEGYFDEIITGDMVTHSKPHPEIFLLAAEKLAGKDFDVKECAVFEDSKNGLLAAFNGGFAGFIVPDQMDPTPEYPGKYYARLNSLDEAIPLLME